MALQGSGQISIAEIRDACTTCDNSSPITVNASTANASRTVVTSTATTSDLAGLVSLVNVKDGNMDTSTPYGMNEFYNKNTSSRIKHQNNPGTGNFYSTATIAGQVESEKGPSTSTTFYDIPLGSTAISLSRSRTPTGTGGSATLTCI
jgi:hypothetical protein